MLSSLILSAALMAPPGMAEDHSQPYHSASILRRESLRHPVDLSRRQRWEIYARDLSEAWAEYRRAGSTPEAFRAYVQTANRLKSDYVWADEYLEPIVRVPLTGSMPLP